MKQFTVDKYITRIADTLLKFLSKMREFIDKYANSTETRTPNIFHDVKINYKHSSRSLCLLVYLNTLVRAQMDLILLTNKPSQRLHNQHKFCLIYNWLPQARHALQI